ncbi:MAG: SRPBCC family protein, partial [Candidatus Limnocylindria bacterium]
DELGVGRRNGSEPGAGSGRIPAMITPSASIRIAAQPATVISFIADPTNAPRWMKALEVAELITPGPIACGSRFREVMYGGGFTAIPVEGGTELRYDGWATTSGELAGRVRAWARQAQREAEAELAAIKAAIERAASVDA